MSKETIQAWSNMLDEAKANLDFLQNKFSIVSLQKARLTPILEKAERNIGHKIMASITPGMKSDKTLLKYEIEWMQTEQANRQDTYTKLYNECRVCLDQIAAAKDAVTYATEDLETAIEESKEGDYQITVFKNAPDTGSKPMAQADKEILDDEKALEAKYHQDSEVWQAACDCSAQKPYEDAEMTQHKLGREGCY